MANIYGLNSGWIKITGKQFSIKKASEEKDARSSQLNQSGNIVDSWETPTESPKDTIDYGWGVPHELTRDSTYFRALEELRESGIKVDDRVIDELTPERGRDPAYIRALIKLQKSGIKIDSKVIYALTPEKARDSAYIELLKRLPELGVKIDDSFISALTPEKARNSAYIGALEELQKSGITVDGDILYWLTPEKANSAYIGALEELQKSGIAFNGNTLYWLTPEKANPAYIGALKELQKFGIQVDGEVIHDLAPEVNSAYMEALQELRNLGVKIDIEVVRSLPPDEFNLSYIGALKELQKSGITYKNGINIFECLLSVLTPEKAKDPAYVGALMGLQNSGIQIAYNIQKVFPPEKASDPAFIGALEELQRSGIKFYQFLLYLLQIPNDFYKDAAYFNTYKVKALDGFAGLACVQWGNVILNYSGAFGPNSSLYFFHEVGHIWDYYESKEEDARLSQLNQSDNQFNRKPLENEWSVPIESPKPLELPKDTTNSGALLDKCILERLYKQISWSFDGISWPIYTTFHYHADSEEFASDYGRTNPVEDFAEIFKNYIVHGHEIRGRIREQLSSGKIKLAAKYIYLKYLTPFKGKEYETELDRPLTVQELIRSIDKNKIDAPEVIKKIIEKARAEEPDLKSR